MKKKKAPEKKVVRREIETEVADMAVEETDNMDQTENESHTAEQSKVPAPFDKADATITKKRRAPEKKTIRREIEKKAEK